MLRKLGCILLVVLVAVCFFGCSNAKTTAIPTEIGKLICQGADVADTFDSRTPAEGKLFLLIYFRADDTKKEDEIKEGMEDYFVKGGSEKKPCIANFDNVDYECSFTGTIYNESTKVLSFIVGFEIPEFDVEKDSPSLCVTMPQGTIINLAEQKSSDK